MVSVLAAGWMGENDLLRAAAAVACAAGHPVAEALLREADCRVVRVVDALNCERRADGAAGVVAGSRILVGSPEYLLDHDVDLSCIPPMEIDWSMLLVAADGRFAGIVRVTPE